MATHWDTAAKGFRGELSRTLDTELLRRLHRPAPAVHFLILLRHLAVLALAVLVILRYGHLWYAWIPASIAIGFVVFGFSVLLHEVVHKTIFRGKRPGLYKALGWLYALPSGLSAAQFTRWHLDHHDNLGTDDRDPKRAELSPKRHTRWFKALYFTPALFPIYFRAARRAGAAYPPELRARIGRERGLAMLFHLGLAAALWLTLGFELALKLHLLPVFVVFPVAFALNRLGQHYDVVPEDPARWGTLIRPSPLLWDQVYLWSNYHLEHHYFPKVPFHNLPRLHKALRPFFDERKIRRRRYGGLLYDWLVMNRTPHTDWTPS